MSVDIDGLLDGLLSSMLRASDSFCMEFDELASSTLLVSVIAFGEKVVDRENRFVPGIPNSMLRTAPRGIPCDVVLGREGRWVCDLD
jgi:hypothetical protein